MQVIGAVVVEHSFDFQLFVSRNRIRQLQVHKETLPRSDVVRLSDTETCRHLETKQFFSAYTEDIKVKVKVNTNSNLWFYTSEHNKKVTWSYQVLKYKVNTTICYTLTFLGSFSHFPSLGAFIFIKANGKCVAPP